MPELSPLDNSESDEESDSEETNPEDNETVHKYSIPDFRLLKPSVCFAVPGGQWNGDWSVVSIADRKRFKCWTCHRGNCRHCRNARGGRCNPEEELEGDTMKPAIPVRWQCKSTPGKLQAVSTSQQTIPLVSDQRQVVLLEKLYMEALEIQRPYLHMSILSEEKSLPRLHLRELEESGSEIVRWDI